MICTRLLTCAIAFFFAAASCPQVGAQGILDDDLKVAEPLRPFDKLLQSQLRNWFDAREAVLTEDGKQTPQWWEVAAHLNPVAIHGSALLKYAKEHPGTPEALICLAYIIDWGEGEPDALYRAACDELLTNYSNHPALSWLCSRAANSLHYESMNSFLTRLRSSSTNPKVQAAAAFNLARLMDNVLRLQSRLPEVHETFRESGALQGRPSLRSRLEMIARKNPDELRRQRDRLLKDVKDRLGDRRAMAARRTFGRLNYEFFEDPNAPTFQELADELLYEIAHLRPGCLAPDFRGTLTDGQEFHLQQRRGKPTLLMFSFKGCGACEAMYPTLRSLQQRFSGAGFSVIGVMVEQEQETVTAAIKSGAISWPCVWDGPSGPIAQKFRARAFPTVILVDGDGRIAARDVQREQNLTAQIEGLIASQKAQPAKKHSPPETGRDG